MIIRVFNCIVFVVCCATVYGLFIIKNQVRIFRYQTDELNKQIIEERDKINILKTEVAYLASPERLRAYSIKYLKLENVASQQMIADPLLQDNIDRIELRYETVNNEKNHNMVKWRYKRMASKYIQRVVARHN